MDKSDVQMEDAETQSYRGLDSVKASEDGIPGGTELKLAQPQESPSSLAITDDNKKSHVVDYANSQLSQLSFDNTVEEEQSNAKFELQDQKDSQCRKEDECVDMESGDQTKAGQTNHTEEEIKGTNDAEQQNGAKCGDEGDCPDAETETKGEADFISAAAKEQSSSENGKEAKDTLDSVEGEKTASKDAEEEMNNHSDDGELPFQLPVSEVPPKKKEALDEVHQSESGETVMEPAQEVHQSETEGLVKEELENKSVLPASVSHHEKTVTKVTKPEAVESPFGDKRQPATPDFPLKYSSRRSAGYSGSGEAIKNVLNDDKMAENDDGTPEQQAAFIKELENFYRQRGVEFKSPKFYGQPLNCYKLWTAVIKLGGYDLVTGTKLWRQVGESFHPPKTCTTVSWTFRIFYEKSLLEYERYKVQNGEIELPAATLPEPSGADNEGNGYQASGSGRARRDAAARAMQGWHTQRLYNYGEDKSPNNMQKRENKLKSIGSLKQKRPNEVELPVKTQRTETSKQLVTTVVDVGPPADWVKINVRETKDCFEVYALVPGLLREEVRVQSDPAGRLVITGQPEQTDNPWGITSFRKVITLPARIDPLQTSAVVSLHGRLFVRVPFEQSS